MFKYTIKRLLQSVVTVLIVVTIVFLLMRMLPTDYFFTEDQLMKFTPEQKEEQLQAAGLLDPMPKQLVRYYGQLLKFDFGESRRIQNGVDVVSVIGDKFTISMKLGCTALVISLFVGILIGIIQTLNKDRILDHVGTAYTIFVNAVPALCHTHLCWHLFESARASVALFDTESVRDKYTSDRMSVTGIYRKLCTLDETLYGR